MRTIEDRLFSAFQRSGSPRALGRVYDRVADELMRVALHLARDPAEAEDLVQLTFVTAIERAKDFETGARVLPWLLGILARHAKAQNRRGARRPDPLRLHVRRGEEPDARAEEVELDRHVERALRSVPESYRPVLVLRLRHGLSAGEIADALGQPTGTVRSQIAHIDTSKLQQAPRWVACRALDSTGRFAWSGAARRLEDGIFEARVSVAPGFYRLIATAPGDRRVEFEFTVTGLDGKQEPVRAELP